jgi:hypothetical protein
MTPDARFALVVVDGPPAVVIVDIGKNPRLPDVTIDVPQNPKGIAISPNGSEAYIVSESDVKAVNIGDKSASVISVAPPNGLTATAISPDGKTLYVVSKGRTLHVVPLPGGKGESMMTIPGNGNADRIVISPDGSTAYISIRPGDGAVGSIAELGLRGNGPAGTTISFSKGNEDPTALAIATSPTGKSTLFVADGNNNSLIPIAIPTPNLFPPKAIISLPSAPEDLASTPDGSRLEVSTFRGAVTDVDTSTGTANTCQVRSKPCPLGAGSIVITPNQPPTAAFTATPLPAALVSTFDATASTIAFGKIASYRWDFGDGAIDTTTVPLASHVYAAPGTYTVTLTETDSAGGSSATSLPSTVFTGQTMSRRGGPSAQTTRQIVIPAGSSSGPTITLSPTVGRPGAVVSVSGRNFPHNQSITLTWPPGLGSMKVTTDGLGSFQGAPMFVFPRDEPGPRTMVAMGFEKTANASFLVEPSSVEPGGRDLLLLYRR